MNEDYEAPAADSSTEVAEVLAQIRAGVRQRQAELATISAELKKLPPALAEAHELRYVEEPTCSSHRPIVGRWIVLAKTLVYKAFMKWYLDSVLQQQNAFNRAASASLRHLFERQATLAAELEQLAELLDRAGDA